MQPEGKNVYEQPRALGTHEEGGGRDWHPASIAGL